MAFMAAIATAFALAAWAAIAPASDGASVSGNPTASAAKKKSKTKRYRGPRIDTANSSRCDWLDPRLCLLPWPNNHFTKKSKATETGRRLNLNVESTPKNAAGTPIDPTEWNRNDGFSPGQLIVVHIDGMDTQAAFDATGIVPETNIRKFRQPDQPVVLIDAKTRKRNPIFAELDARATEATDRHLLIRPMRNLVEGRRYIVALRDMKDADGKTIKAPNAFRVYRDRLKTKQRPVEKRRKSMERILKTLTRAGIERKSLYLAWDFTVASSENQSERVLTMRDDAFKRLGDTNLADNVVQGNAPVVKDLDVNSPGGGVYAEVNGKVEVPCYLDKADCSPGSKFKFSGPNALFPNLTPSGTADVPFRCIIPDSANDGGTGANPGIPMMYGHGLLGSRSQVSNSVNRQFADDNDVVICGVDWAGFADEDLGVIAAALQDFSKIPKTFDRMQQGFVNFMYLGRAMIHPQGLAAKAAFKIGGESVIDIDSGAGPGNDLYFQGISQGGIMGGALTAINPDFVHSALDVTGMNYSTLLERSVDFDTYDALINPNYPDRADRELILSMLQNLWDRGEKNGYVHHLTDDPYPNTPEHQVLMHVAYGDHQVSPMTAEVAARTAGIGIVYPPLAPGRHWESNASNPKGPYWGLDKIATFPYTGSALVYYDGGPTSFTGDEGQGTDRGTLGNLPNRTGEDPHGYPRRVTAAQQQNLGFFDLGRLFDPCGGVIFAAGNSPCYSNGWDGSF